MIDKRPLVERLRGIASGELMQKATETRATIIEAADAIEQLTERLNFAVNEQQAKRLLAAEARLRKAERLAEFALCMDCGGITDRELGFWGGEDDPASTCPDRMGYHAAFAAFRTTEDAK